MENKTQADGSPGGAEPAFAVRKAAVTDGKGPSRDAGAPGPGAGDASVRSALLRAKSQIKNGPTVTWLHPRSRRKGTVFQETSTKNTNTETSTH